MNLDLLTFLDWTAVLAVIGVIVAMCMVTFSGVVTYTPWPGPGKVPAQAGTATFRKGFVLVAACVGMGFLCAFVATAHVRNFLRAALEPAASPQAYLDGKADRSDSLIAALRAMRTDRTMRSASNVRVSVEIRSIRGNVSVELARDAVQADAYWVFVPPFLITSNNNIGLIYTDALADLE
jgi:hypothetical protein